MYKLLDTSDMVFCYEGNKFIPNDPYNKDWIAYQAWLALGNTPEAA